MALTHLAIFYYRMASLFPPIKWAQRKESLFVTVDIPDVDKKSAVITLGPKELHFKGKSQGKDYEVTLGFLHEIDDQSSETKWQVKPRHVSFFLKKKTDEWWSRLLENAQIQKSKVKTDFDKWKDEDEGADEDFKLGGDFEGLGGMGGMGGMPGMGGMGGMPGMGGFDMESLMKQMQANGGGMPGMGDMDDDDEGDDGEGGDDNIPELEESK